jgi:uncharacterized protein (TIGR03437 family)
MKTITLPALLLVIAAAQSFGAQGKLPLAFEPNHGQGDRESKFFARGPGYTVALRPDGAAIHSKSISGKRELTVMRLIGASTTAMPLAKDPLPGKVNYFIGSNPKNWYSNLPTFSKVEFPRAYPGIDLVYYGSEGRLEYDFIVQPGANPASIRMRFSGAGRLKLAANGDLEVGGLLQHKPVAYQTIAVNQRTAVPCRYVLRANQEVVLELGSYDKRYPLIVDPVISYATYVGGSGNDTVGSIKVDASGNLYMAGFTTSANFPVRGAAQTAYGGTNSALLQAQFGDAFVAKLNPAGNAMIYATYIGGSGDDFATSLAIDAGGSAYVVGSTQSANFPTTAGALQRTYKGFGSDDNGFYNPGDGFVAKLNPAGSALVYATYLGGALNDLPMGVAVDSAGNAVVVGSTKSSDFPTTANALSTTYRGASNTGSAVAGDAFVSILNAAGTALTYSTFLGGRGHDMARGVAVDGQNNIYVCGMTSSSDFPVTTGALQTTYKGDPNLQDFDHPVGHGFVAKISAQGAIVYATFLGGSLRDGAAAIAVDGAGAAYVVGGTASTDFPTTANAPQKTNKGRGTIGTLGDLNYGDAFVSKLNAAGSALVYSTFLGGAADETASDIAIDSAGNAFVTGFTLSNDFPVTTDALQAANSGFGGQALAAFPLYGFNTERQRNSGDAFLVKLSDSGALTYSSFFGGKNDDAGLAIAVDAAGNAYIAGNTLSTTLSTSSGTLQQSYGGATTQFPRGDGFVAKFDFGGKLPAPPARVGVVTGFPASGTAGATLATPFAVEVLDAQGVKLPGVSVAFSATNATVNPASATTDAQGRASTTVTLGSAVGTAVITATVAGIPAATANVAIGAAAQLPVVKAIVNGASFLSTVAPGSWITVYIDQTAAANASASAVPLPTNLGGYRILVNGSPIPMLLVYALTPGTQINAQLPYEVPAGSAQVVVEANGVASAPFAFTVQAAAPGIFVFGDNRAVVQNVQPDASLIVNTATTPVPAGDYIVAYLTGQGALDNPITSGDIAKGPALSIPKLPYSATLAGKPVPVAFLGMTPGLIALAQANILIPADTLPGTYPLVITIGTASSNGPQITVTTKRP